MSSETVRSCIFRNIRTAAAALWLAGIAACSAADETGNASTESPAQRGATVANAPSGDTTAGQRRGGSFPRLLRGIELTAEQTASIDSIRRVFAPQMRSLREAGGSPPGGGRPADPAVRQQITELRRQQRAAVRAVLTAKQQVIFDRNAAEQSRRRQRQGER